MSSTLLFYISAITAICGGIIMLFSRNTVNSAMGLLLSFVSTAGIYLSISSPFLAVAQIFLYSGAVAVLIVFVIMMIDEQKKYELPVHGLFSKSIAIVSVCYIGYVLIDIMKVSSGASVVVSDMRILGRLMISDYLLHIEALSLVLIISIMAAILVAKRKS
ncbi:MAG: NADH-quinone oxidoreductase subunit J [Deltaproteobacteria bacterium]|nr:NADH-quinone oxidoreductase subunit J [Deltaproteobacteria bacterium]